MSTVVRTASILLVLVVALVQAALMWRMSIAGATPNLLIVVVASIALLTGPITGAVSGFAAGLGLALFGALPLGPHAMLATLVGYAIGRVGEQLVTDDHPAPPLLAAVFACAAMSLGRPLVEFLVNPATSDVDGVWRITFLSTALGAMLAVPVYLGVRRYLTFATQLAHGAGDEVVA